MTFLYLDASAWVKRCYRERGSDRIHELLSGEDPRVCSVLGVVEVIATLARKRKAQEITPQDFDAKVADIERDWQSFVQIELTLGTLVGSFQHPIENLRGVRLPGRDSDLLGGSPWVENGKAFGGGSRTKPGIGSNENTHTRCLSQMDRNRQLDRVKGP